MDLWTVDKNKSVIYDTAIRKITFLSIKTLSKLQKPILVTCMDVKFINVKFFEKKIPVHVSLKIHKKIILVQEFNFVDFLLQKNPLFEKKR
jgi:hypothetical protein